MGVTRALMRPQYSLGAESIQPFFIQTLTQGVKALMLHCPVAAKRATVEVIRSAASAVRSFHARQRPQRKAPS